jgi:predicted alpha/beta hydrolase
VNATPFPVSPVSIRADDGRELAGLLVTAAEPRGAMLISAGSGFPREFYLKFAYYAASRGYHALVYDYRGMGKSRIEPLSREPARMSDWGAHDIPSAFDWLAQQFPQLPLVTVGHSIGAQFVGMIRDPSRATHVMVAASVGYWKWELVPFRYLAWYFWKIHGPLMLRIHGYVPQGIAWRGLPLPRGIFEQWRGWCMRPSHFGPELEGGELRNHHFKEVRGPLLCICIEDDPIATHRTVEPLLQMYPNAEKEVRWISPKSVGARRIGHGGFFAERHRETLWRSVLDWIDARSGAIADRASPMAPSVTTPPTI